jgi:transcriptional regulator with XRE-family HTH domain
MNLRRVLRRGRDGAGLTLRQLARQAATSHSTLAAYEAGRVSPTVETLDRVARAAGYDLTIELTPRVSDPDRGRELIEVLELAAMFPARHDASLTFPVFGRTPPAHRS